MKKIKQIREYFLNSKNHYIYIIFSRGWSFFYALQLALEFFKFKYFWSNLIYDIKDNISNCDAIYKQNF